MRDIFLLIALAAMVPPLLMRPYLGIAIWAWVALFSPINYMFGFMQDAPTNKAIAIVSLFALACSKQTRRFRIDANDVLLFLLIVIGTLSNELSDSHLLISADIYDKLLKAIVFCWAMKAAVQTRLQLHTVVLAATLGLAFHGVVEGLKFIASGANHHVEGRISLGDNNQFALALIMIMPMVHYIYLYSQRQLVRFGCLAANLLCLLAVVATYSRGGFIGLLIVALGLVAGGRRKVVAVLALGTVAVALAFALPQTWNTRISTIDNADQDASFMGRVIAWKISTLMALDNPVIGSGFHAVQDPQVWNRYVPDFGRLDFIQTDEPTNLPHAAHSIYFEILGDLGFSGLFVFLSLIATGLLQAHSIKKLTRGRPDLRWCYDLAGALQLSLIAYAVSGAALSMAYFEFFYMVAAMLSVVRRLALAKVADTAAARPAVRITAGYAPQGAAE